MKSDDIEIGQQYSINKHRGKISTATVIKRLPNGLFELDDGEIEYARNIKQIPPPLPPRLSQGIRYEVKYGNIIHSAIHCISHGLGSFRCFRGLIRIILVEEGWRNFVVKCTGETREYKSFEDWVRAPVPYGLESDISTVRLLCKLEVKATSEAGERYGLTMGEDNDVTEMIDREVGL
jgi:hypothetical protein